MAKLNRLAEKVFPGVAEDHDLSPSRPTVAREGVATEQEEKSIRGLLNLARDVLNKATERYVHGDRRNRCRQLKRHLRWQGAEA